MPSKPVRVSQLNAYIKRVLSSDPNLSNISVVGEISNFKRHSSGHVYFNLKDSGSRINCFLPQNVFRSLSFELGDGLEIVANGQVSVYEPSGSYSLSIRSITVNGAGDLNIAFEKLRAKLEAEGLFDERYKKSLPFFPSMVAIVTSCTGAAIEDMLKIITEKNDFVDILIVPTLVQGPDAAPQIAAGIEAVNRCHPETDVMIIGRGGGSAEDLWAFNEEIVARAIFASEIPIISAVGHEVDVTISDYVADVRAETPTAAAQLAVPDLREVRFMLDKSLESLENTLQHKAERLKMRLDSIGIDRIGIMERQLIEHARMRSEHVFSDVSRHIDTRLSEARHQADTGYRTIETLSPLGILNRGYAALTDGEGLLIRSAAQLKPGDEIQARLADGRAALSVTAAEKL
jgi:exodeoxyribonuclease VII large subunit